MSQNIPAQVQAADYAAPGKSFTGGIATLKRHHTWRDGDFSLISSDFVVFKVSSRILQAVSKVLMTSDKFDDLIQQEDAEFYQFVQPNEDAYLIEDFLRFATGGQLLSPTQRRIEAATDLLPLIDFLGRHRCFRLRARLESGLHELLVMKRIEPMHALALASVLDALALCVTALEKACFGAETDLSIDITAPTKSDTPFCHGRLLDSCPIDPGCLDLATFRIIRPHHMWALNRAWALGIEVDDQSEYGGPVQVTRNFETIVSEFRLALMVQLRLRPA